MIELRALTKRYRSRVAVDTLTVTIEPGRVTGFQATWQSGLLVLGDWAVATRAAGGVLLERRDV